MAGDCPALSPQDPLVRGLIGVVDCNVQTLVHGGYSALFQPSSLFTQALTAALTIFVALIGYRLLLGRSRLGVGDFALGAVKIGAVLALATQWGTYQAVVYDTLFHGPEQLASAMLDGMQPRGSQFHGDVFVGLQRAFDDLSAGAGSFANHAPPLGATSLPGLPAVVPTPPAATQVGALLSGDGFGTLLLTATAATLLISTLGVLLAAKIVLGVLLGVGPIFIALFLFDATRGVFEGWLRASLGFAFAPLMATLLTGVALTMLEPSLVEMEDLRARGIFMLEPVYTVTLLVLVFAAVSLGMLVACAVVSSGFRLPGRRSAQTPGLAAASTGVASMEAASQSPRAARIAAAASTQDRRDALIFATAGAADGGDRRLSIATTTASTPVRTGGPDIPAETRLGQGARRSASPRSPSHSRAPNTGASGARTA